MRRMCTIVGLILLWLVLCMLFLTGCHAHAPSGVLSGLGGALESAAEYSLAESLYLFVSTDYGEFCAIVACFMATHLVFAVQQYLLPRLRRYAPRLATWLKGRLQAALPALRAFLVRHTSASEPSDAIGPTGDAPASEDAPADTSDKKRP